VARAQAPSQTPTVRDLAVEGNKRIQASAILNRVQTKIGDPFSPVALREDVQAIFALGFFDDVQVRTEEFEGGVRVVFAVVERPLLREVSYEGNRDMKLEDLREKAALRAGVLYNPAEIQRAAEAIREKYEEDGFLGASVSPRTEPTPEGDVRVVFRITEGRKIHIDRIVIEGNQALTARQIKAAMETKERLFWVLPFSTLHRRVFEDDGDRIVNLYADHGYVQARIESQEIIPDLQRGKVTLKIRVVEGPQFRVGTVAVKGNEVLTEPQVHGLIQLKPGEVFSRKQVRDSLRAITDSYSEIGRARAEVNPETENDVDKRLVNVTFAITEGPEVYVERINITGNSRSSEKVLRRELRLAEGDLFNYQRLVRSRQRLFNLGYFEEVNVATEPGSTPEKIVINISVKERSTGLFSLGAGYSSLDGLFGTVDLTQRNLFGRGYEAFLRFRIGAKSRLGLIGFTDPYFLDLPLRAGFDFYDRTRDFDDFTEDRLGGDLRASYPLGEFWTIGATYRAENVTITNVPDSASDDLKKEIGARINSELDVGLSRDSRDSVFEPTRGSRNSFDLSFAGLGGDVQFYRVIIDSAWFFPLPLFDWVFSARGQVGYAQGWGGQDVPIFERFFLGGATSLRGQRTRSVAPKDAQGDVIGGDKELLFNTELLIPIPFVPHLRLAFFFDAGNAYGFGTAFDPTDLRLAAGAGIRFYSPLGPLRLDYGLNLDKKAGEKTGQINFTVGAPF
jgi:outer membrane protein insertion porin family